MKTFIIYYNGRGSEFRFQSPRSLKIRAYSSKDAKTEALDYIGDTNKIIKVIEHKPKEI